MFTCENLILAANCLEDIRLRGQNTHHTQAWATDVAAVPTYLISPYMGHLKLDVHCTVQHLVLVTVN